MKIARQETAGYASKEHPVPSGTAEIATAPRHVLLYEEGLISVVPIVTESQVCRYPALDRAGLFSHAPAGAKFLHEAKYVSPPGARYQMASSYFPSFFFPPWPKSCAL